MMEQKIDIAHYKNSLSRKHQLVRLLWGIVWPLGTWFLPRSMGMPWKRLLLRMFGAHIDSTANVYSSAKIYYPTNLYMAEHSCLAQDVDCYNVAPIHIGAQSTVSHGMVVAEAMSCGVPVLTTTNCPWEILNEKNTGWCINLSVEELAQRLREAMSMDSIELYEMGQKASQLVFENFNYKSVAQKTKELYEWILLNIPCPKFIKAV